MFMSSLQNYGRQTNCGVDTDYIIPCIKQLLSKRSPKISKLIWDTLIEYGQHTGSQYVFAKYAPNASVPWKQCESSLIYYLKAYAWLPDKQGKLHKPEDVSQSQLDVSFVCDHNNQLLAALKIGSGINKQKNVQEHLDREAKKSGLRVVTEDDYTELQKLRQFKARYEAIKNVDSLSGQELLKKQQKQSNPNAKIEDTVRTTGSVINTKHNSKNIEATFRNAKHMPLIHKKLFGRIVESTKEEKVKLRNWYQGRCQMCNTSIIGYNQVPHFIAKNIINTQDLSIPIRKTTQLAWNSLCLCPNCAMKYDVCSRDLNGLFEQIMQTKIVDGSSEQIALSIELDDQPQSINYAPQHFLALKTVMQLIEDECRE